LTGKLVGYSSEFSKQYLGPQEVSFLILSFDSSVKGGTTPRGILVPISHHPPKLPCRYLGKTSVKFIFTVTPYIPLNI